MIQVKKKKKKKKKIFDAYKKKSENKIKNQLN